MRTSYLDTTLAYSVRVTQQNNGDTYGPYQRTTPVRVEYLERGDIQHSTVVEGFRPPLPYDANGYTRSYGFANVAASYSVAGNSYKAEVGGTTGPATNGLIVPPVTRSLISKTDRDRLLIKLLNDIGNQKWSAGEAIAELQGSIDTIADSARRLAAAAACASRRDWAGTARALKVPPTKVGATKSVADGWLSYSFGWKPMVEDAVQASLYLSGYTRRDAMIIMARGYLKEQQVEKRTDSCAFKTAGTLAPYDIDFGPFYQETDIFTSEFRSSLYYKLDDSFLRGLQSYGLLGLSTPWALVPYSFIVDWFVPVGDYLAAIDATVGLTFLGGSETHFDKVIRSRQTTGWFSIPYGGQVSGSVDWIPAQRFAMHRVVYPESPLPFPAYLKNPLSTFKAVTAIAMLAQQKL